MEREDLALELPYHLYNLLHHDIFTHALRHRLTGNRILGAEFHLLAGKEYPGRQSSFFRLHC